MDTSKKGLTSEDIVIIIVMAFGFLGGLVILKMGFQPIIVSVLFGTGIASLIYRFLGGIEGSVSFNLGPVKFVGALAALIGAAWVIDYKLDKQIQNGHSLSENSLSINPPINEWFGLNKDGNPVSVKIDDLVIEPPSEGLTENRLTLKYDEDQIQVFDRDNEAFSLGYFGMSALKNFEKGSLFNGFPKKVDYFTVTKELNPENPAQDLSRDQIPFKINVTSFDNNKSYYQLLKPNDNSILYEGNITTRGAEIVNIEDKFYFVSVFSVNHQSKKEKKHYAKFLVGALSPELNLD